MLLCHRDKQMRGGILQYQLVITFTNCVMNMFCTHLDSITYGCSKEGRVQTPLTQTGAQGIGTYLKKDTKHL